MASVARPRTPKLLTSPAWMRTAVLVPALFLLGLVAVSLVLKTRALGSSLWMDEGLSIGIASQPLFDIPHVLRVDGSPPLYYMLLSICIKVFGSGPAETQGLSVALALLAIPGGLWAGWSLFGKRAGYICAALFAFNGFLTVYAQETRMDALMITLSLLVTAAYLHVFVYGRRRYLPVFAVFVALMLYTHNWGMFVTAGLLIGLVPIWLWTEERRTLVRNALLGFGGALLLYLPWIPTLVHQVLHTGAPWLNRPHFGAPVQISKSLLGGLAVTTALILGAGSGLSDVIRRRTEDPERRAVVVAATACIGTLAVAWLLSQLSPAWPPRYLGVALGPILLLSALGLARARNLGLVALAIVLGIWAIPKTYDLTHKSNAADLGASASPLLHPGDLVVSMQPEQAPLIDYQLKTRALRFATPMGPVKNPKVMDWTDSQDRLE